MSRKGVRDAVAAWFSPPNVAGLNTVWSGEPRRVQSNDYLAGQPAGTLSGAVGFPYIEGQQERRIAVGGATGGTKEVVYEMAFALRFLSYQTSGASALDDLDALIDAFVVRLRSDRTLGGAVWQAGEGDAFGGQDVHIVSGPGPRQRKADGPIVIWSMARFTAIEMVAT